ncbi:hypothetical protein B0H17DRAFT_1199117 [Mycena rosella]|uniref:Nitrogen regulatory protein areA GATA-like domain-containing protein n=1 Tax=Mycena rosella TaxID=1033263 RepID=A0AAD7DLL8_MYCRO|nr:hypothetical protein B0H17DRAFT_1199117 [Mycena rosella]
MALVDVQVDIPVKALHGSQLSPELEDLDVEEDTPTSTRESLRYFAQVRHSWLRRPTHRQVDYLSHEWAEEDIWRSWRNVTRQKNEIINGMRLENASGALGSSSAKSSRQLKDEDVTWLYGPFYTAIEPPPSKQQLGKKPSTRTQKHGILKNRSIKEQLEGDIAVSSLSDPARGAARSMVSSSTIPSSSQRHITFSPSI